MFNNVKEKVFKYVAPVAASAAIIMTSASAFAEESSASSVITSSITESASSLQTDAIAMIGSIAPYALGIVGAFLLFKLGKKFFSQVGK